ncbi:MAG TPA: hypothetical protein VMU10_09790 [Desulfomonilia bacterium]|nr:hypothetical protein [Desulfomonilia bacterium]
MSSIHFRTVRFILYGLIVIFMPVMALAQSDQQNSGSAPVGQPLVREGDLALKLASELGVTNTDDEVEAESSLGGLDILPSNGWIADYPVTPDIIIELQNTVGAASSEGRLSMNKDGALKKFDDVVAGFGLSISPYTAGTSTTPAPANCQDYTDSEGIISSYSAEGPPVVTYYCPPPDYYYLYTWVPCPFRWSDRLFPGFFILHDFHRVIHRHGKVAITTNHFNELKSHHVFRVDPAERFKRKTFAGIGVSRPKDFISTGIPNSERTIFNGSHARTATGSMTVSPTTRGRSMESASPRGGERSSPHQDGGRSTIERGK